MGYFLYLCKRKVVRTINVDGMRSLNFLHTCFIQWKSGCLHNSLKAARRLESHLFLK